MKIENNLRQEKEKLSKIANSFNQEEYDYYISLTNQQKYDIICQELVLNQTIQQIPLRFRIHVSQLPNQLKQSLIQKLTIYDQDPTDQESVKFRQYVESVLKLPLNVYQNLDNSYTKNNNSNYVNEIPEVLKEYLQNVFIHKRQKNQDINPTTLKKQNTSGQPLGCTRNENGMPIYVEDIIKQIIKKKNKRSQRFKDDTGKIKKRKLNIEKSIHPRRSSSDGTVSEARAKPSAEAPEVSYFKRGSLSYEQDQRQTIINCTLGPFQNFIKQSNQELKKNKNSNVSTDESWKYSENSESSEGCNTQRQKSGSNEGTELLLSEEKQRKLSPQYYQNVEKNESQALFRVKLKKEDIQKTFIVNQQNLENYIYNQIDEEQINTQVQNKEEKVTNKGKLKLNQDQMKKAEELMQKCKKKTKIKNIYENNKKMLKKISEQLNKEIHGQEQAKQQLLQIMAKWLRSPESSGRTIGLQSPPGCGKTALVKNGLARALDRPVEFINLGGMKDLSVLKGHSYCYVGSTYGLVSQSLIKSKCMNPIIVFDELDKLDEAQNQISQFLMHITDPTQNQQFIDDYFHEIQIDLSKCLFIFTYNDSEKINKILYDRINEVQMQGYNNLQKIEILTNFSIPKLLKNYQFEKDQVQFNQETLNYLVQNYSQNEGVRKLEQNIEYIIANINLQHYISDNEQSNDVLWAEGLHPDQQHGVSSVMFPELGPNFKQVTVTTKMIDKILQSKRNDLSYRMMYI